MTDTYTIDIPALPRSFRILFLLFGLMFLPIGVFSLVKVLLAVATVLSGGTQEGSWIIGIVVTVLLTGIGGVALWAFFIPAKTLRFIGQERRATLTLTYPFGLSSQQTFDFSDIPSPEVVWIDDFDRMDEGYWALKIALPNGTVLTRPAWDEDRVAQQREAAEAWRDRITELVCT